MDQARQFIDMIGAGDNVSAKDLVDSILSARAFEALEAKKQDLAATLFSGITDAGVSEPVTVGESIEEETELNLEDFTPEEIEAFMQTEDFEQLDELSKTTLASYAKKSTNSARINGILQGRWEADSDRANKPAKKNSLGRIAKDFQNDGWKREAGVKKAVDRLAK